MNKKITVLFFITFFVLLVDQITKVYIHTGYTLHESKTIIDGLFNLTYVRNPGAAFGMLQSAPAFFRKLFFLSLTPIVLTAILYFLITGVRKDDNLQIAAFSLVFGGAIGNYIDRIRFEYVIDFLDFYVGDLHWPAFNVADSAIVVGVMILIFCSFNEERVKKTKG